MRKEMIWHVVDNCGIKTAKQLNVLTSKTQKTLPGDFLTVFPKKFRYVKLIKRQTFLGLVTNLKKKIKRPGGVTIQGFANEIIIFNNQKKYLASKIFKPSMREFKSRRTTYIYKRVYARIPRYV